MTAAALGGDFYDWFILPNGRLVIAVGDVAGHGIPSALVAASAKIELAMNTEVESDPARVLVAINDAFLRQVGRKRPMSFWLGIFDPVTRLLHFANGGQNFPLVLLNGAEPKMLESKGYPLGSRKNPSYQGASIDLSAGGRLFAYSDGMVEAQPAPAQPFGYDRLTALASKTMELPPNAAIEQVFAEIHHWSGLTVPEDDQTLLILQVAPKTTAESGTTV